MKSWVIAERDVINARRTAEESSQLLPQRDNRKRAREWRRLVGRFSRTRCS